MLTAFIIILPLGLQ